MLASESGDTETVKALIRKSANVNIARDVSKKSALAHMIQTNIVYSCICKAFYLSRIYI